MPNSFTQSDLVAGLRRLGVEPGMALEVHSSLSSLGWVEGGPGTVVQALMEAVGPEGTLVMSAYPVTLPIWPTEEEKGRGVVAMVRFLNDDDGCRTGMGAIADTFRQWPRTRLGSSPNRVCAWGKDAERHLQGYGYLLSIDGWVLLIGVDIHRCSCMHQAENEVEWPQDMLEYSRLPDDLQRRYPEDEWYVQYNDPPEDGWGKVQAEAERRGLIRRGQIGKAACMLFKARSVVEIYARWLRDDIYGLFGYPR